MVYIEILGQDVVAPANFFPTLPIAPGFMTRTKQTSMGEILEFPPGDAYFFVPTGVERQYRPVRVYGADSMVWDHEVRDFLLKENLHHLRMSPLPSCLTIETMPDPTWEQREAEACRLREEQAARRRLTNQRYNQRPARRAALAATLRAADPQHAAPAPITPGPLAPVAPAPPATASVAPASIAPALDVPALVALAPGNGGPVSEVAEWLTLIHRVMTGQTMKIPDVALE